jgi:hypothetical protein
MVKTLLVANNLDSHRFPRAVIATMQHLAKRSFAKSIDYFIAIRKVIVIDNKIVTAFIIIAIIVG